VAEKPKWTLSLARAKAKNRGEENKSSKETNLGAARKSLRKGTPSEGKKRSDNRYGYNGEKKDSQGTNVEGKMGRKNGEIQRTGKKIQLTVAEIKVSNPVERLRRNGFPQLTVTA